MTQSPEFADVEKAVERLKGHAVMTSLIRARELDQFSGCEVWIKPECQQKVGAFKYRGAFNRLSAMTQEERARGVVAFSSGNHAQGVSRAAKELGMSAIIVMPQDAPEVKVAGVKRDGAEIVFYDRLTESREDIAAEIAVRDGRTVVPSFDDPYIIAGQGTVGFEIAQEAEAMGVSFDAVIMPLGGGGLCAGISLAMQKLSPQTRIFGAEPEGYNDHRMSLRAGKPVRLTDTPPTICDAIMTPCPGKITWPINSRSLTDVFTVSDQACLEAMRLAHEHCGLTAEPGGAAALAAVAMGVMEERNIRNVCVVVSGGNVDPKVFSMAVR